MKLSAKKVIFLSLTGVVLFFITALVLAVLLIDPNDYKQKIQSELSTRTGYNISIPGNIELKLFPQLSLAVEQIKLSGKSPAQKLSVDTHKLNLNVKLLSLFSGEPRIGTINIAKSIIATDKNSPAHIVNNIELASSGFKPDQDTTIDIKLNYLTPDKIVLPIRLHSDLLYKSTDKSIHLSKINFTMQMLRLSGESHIVPVDSQYNVTGNISTQTFSPRKLTALFAITLPEMQDKNALEKFSLTSKFRYSNNTIKFDSLKTIFDKTTLTGDLGIHLKPDYPVNFDLSADMLNVDDYRPVPTTNVPNKSGSTNGKNATDKDAANPLAILAANLNGQLKLNKMVFNNLKTQDIVLKFSSKKNNISISPSAKLYGGTFNGMVHLSAQNNTLRVSGEQSLAQVNMGQLLVDYMGEKLVDGISDLNLKFNSNGKTADILVKNMIAAGKVKLTDAQLMSIKIARSILNDSKLSKLIKDQSSDKEVTVFDTITASFAIKDAIVNNTDLHAVSKRARVTGTGTVNLLAQTLDYKANYIYNKSHIIRFTGVDIDLKDKPIPVYLRGPLTNPKYDVKSNVLLDAIAADYKKSEKYKKVEQKKEKLEEKKHKLEDKVKNKLKDLFN